MRVFSIQLRALCAALVPCLPLCCHAKPLGYDWRSVPIGSGGYLLTIAVDPQRPNTVWAGCDAGGVYKSTNFGATWRIVNNGIGKFGLHSVASLAIDPRDPNMVCLATGTWFGDYQPGKDAPCGGVWKTTDGGENWQLLPTQVRFGGHALEEFAQCGKLLAIDPSDPRIVYAGSMWDGVFKTRDAGRRWKNVGLKGRLIKGLTISRLEPDRLLVGASTSEHVSGGLLLSTDGGRSWRTALDAVSAWGVAFSPSAPNVAYACCWDKGVYRSADHGDTWSPVDIRGLGHGNIEAVAADPHQPGRLWVSVSGNGLFVGVPR